MQVVLYVLLLVCFVEAKTLQEIEQDKKEIINSLPIEGEEKNTIADIVDSSFNLRAYKENYFLPVSYRYDSEYVDDAAHGHRSKSMETEFQVSIRYDFTSNLFGLGEIYSFGYTQRAWWQLYTESAFFRETNYQPEIFVTVPTYKFLKNSYLKGLKFAYIHQSNGRGGVYERSWNHLSATAFLFYRNIIGEFEMWYRIKDKNDYNPQLLDYIGYGQFKCVVPYKQHLFKLTLRSNVRKRKSSVELSYSYPLPLRQESDLFVYIKSFNGYGESLIDYNHNVNKLSIGLAISR